MPHDDVITSSENRLYKRLKKAIDEHDDEIVIEGPKHVADAVASGWEPVAIVAREDASPAGGVRPDAVFSARLFKSVSDTVTSQGVLALFHRPVALLPAAMATAGSPVVVLDGIQDPGNVGTIVRLAAAFDAAAVVCTEGTADPFSQKAIRASAGCAISLPVVRCTRKDLLAAAARARRPLFVASARADAVDDALPANAVIVFGSEGRGAAPDIERAATAISVPMSPRVESLNVAAAAAVILAGSYRARSARGDGRR